jgi:arylsulfatase A-like enzyme
MIGDYLKKAGYVTGCVGKWHNTGSIGKWDGKMANNPLGRGFDEFFGFLGGMHDYFDSDLGTHFKQGKNRPHYMPIYKGTERVSDVGYLTEVFTDQAVQFIRRHKDRPFFLYLAYNAIHTPHQAPTEYLARYEHMTAKEARWRAVLDVLDEGIGIILNVLEQSGLDRNTMVMFIGDNGAHIPEGNWKFRGQKGMFFEGGIRIPWLIRWRGRLAEGVHAEPAMHIDILPTLLAAADIDLPRSDRIDGVNLLPSLRSSVPIAQTRALFWGRTNGTRYAVRQEPWKLVREANKPAGEPSLRLYHLQSDPWEVHDISASEGNTVSILSESYKQWVQRIRE